MRAIHPRRFGDEPHREPVWRQRWPSDRRPESLHPSRPDTGLRSTSGLVLEARSVRRHCLRRWGGAVPSGRDREASGIDVAQNQQSFESLLGGLVRPDARATGNDIGVSRCVLGESKVLVCPAQPSASDFGAIRRRQGSSPRESRRARRRARWLPRPGALGRQQ